MKKTKMTIKINEKSKLVKALKKKENINPNELTKIIFQWLSYRDR